MVRALGWQFVRMPGRNVSISVPASELQEVDQILLDFSGETNVSQLQNYSELRSYLNKERIALFHEIVDLLIANDVEFDAKIIGDVGCGMGYLFRRISQVGRPERMTGYDTFFEILDLGKKVCPEANFENKSIYEVDRQHDITFCMEVLEHMVDPGEALQQLDRQTRPDGILVLSVPNGRYDFQESGKIREDGKSYWGHIHFWSPESWLLFLKENISSGNDIKTGLLGKRHLYAIIQKQKNRH